MTCLRRTGRAWRFAPITILLTGCGYDTIRPAKDTAPIRDATPSVPDCIAETEVCDGRDNDCDGAVDEDLGEDWYVDGDGDGFGSPAVVERACAAPPGFVSNARDCDDASEEIHPDAEEVCNGMDDDCDEEIDEALPMDVWYTDADADGAGDPDRSVTACSAPDGMVDNAGDCDDADSFRIDCASCADVLARGWSEGDGAYRLDPTGTGSAEYTCDMTTDGGGWTLVFDWEKHRGHDQADFLAQVDVDFDTLSSFVLAEQALQWCDDTSGGGAWSGTAAVVVPNGGEVRYTVGAKSEEDTGSSGFIWLETASAAETLACGDEHFWPHLYTTAELDVRPYDCSMVGHSYEERGRSDFWSLYEEGQRAMADPVAAIHIDTHRHNSHCGDRFLLRSLVVWVR